LKIKTKLFLTLALASLVIVKIAISAALPDFFIKKATELRASGDASTYEVFSDSFLLLKILVNPLVAVGFSELHAIQFVTVCLGTIISYRILGSLYERTRGFTIQDLIVIGGVIPSVFYFSLVGLRDGMLYSVLLLFWTEAFKSNRSKLFMVVLGFLACLLRPELLPVILITFIPVRFFSLRRIIFLGLFFLLTIPFWIMLVENVLSLGLNKSLTDLSNFRGNFIDPRFLRQFNSDGYNSSLVEQRTYWNLSLPELMIVQAVAFYFNPAWKVAELGLLGVLTLLDSFLLIALIVYVMRKLRMGGAIVLRRFFLFLILILSLEFIFFTVNFGNAFRIRMMIWALVVAGYCTSVSRNSFLDRRPLP
jgi:hypothetical protein